MTCRTLQRVCAAAPPSQQRYDDLVGLLEGLDDTTPLVASVDAERILVGEWVFGQSKDELKQTLRQYVYEDSDYASDSLNWLRFRRICFKPAFLADHAAYLRCMHEHARLFEGLSPPGNFKRLEEAVEEAERRHILAGRLAPAMRRINQLHARMTAEIHITRAGLALLRHKRQHGAWPEDLDALGIDNIDDPFTRTSLRYHPEGDRFVLYSVGGRWGRQRGRRQGTEAGQGFRYHVAVPRPADPVIASITGGYCTPAHGRVSYQRSQWQWHEQCPISEDVSP